MSCATHILQPIHSRISSRRPSSIFRGKNGSAIEGRAAPIKSITPRLICDTIASAEVNRPTPTTGLLVRVLTNAVYCSWKPSIGSKRAVAESLSQPLTFTSQRSGSSASIPIISRPSHSARNPSSPRSSSTASRMATAHWSPTASLTAVSISLVRRTRFSRLPPY